MCYRPLTTNHQPLLSFIAEINLGLYQPANQKVLTFPFHKVSRTIFQTSNRFVTLTSANYGTTNPLLVNR